MPAVSRCLDQGLVQLTLPGACEPSPVPVYPNVVEAPAPSVLLYVRKFPQSRCQGDPDSFGTGRVSPRRRLESRCGGRSGSG